MAHQITFLRSENLVLVRFTGRVDAAEILAVVEALPHHAAFRPGLDIAADFREARVDLRAADMPRLAAAVRALEPAWGAAKWAIVSSSLLAPALSRLYAAWAGHESIEVRTFRSLQDADRWRGAHDGTAFAAVANGLRGRTTVQPSAT